MEEAYEWYESQRPRLGEEFLDAVGKVMQSITENPELYAVIHRQTRRALVRRFPYGVFYRLVANEIIIVACYHAKRDPRGWQSRA